MDDGRAVVAEGLRKRYGGVAAIDGVSFEVGRGEILGMVGPNGAGKTTIIECIEGLRRPDEGRVQVLGLDPWRDAQRLRERVGMQLQAASLPQRMKVGEAVDLFAAFYQRVADRSVLLERLGLAEARRQYVSQLSGGQRQRLFVALALINRPEVVFLDELTTGLDPQARRATWELVWEMRTGGTTLLLTTHYMDEAERLCDRVAIVDHGRIIALDSPAALVRGLHAGTRVVFEVDNGYDPAGLAALDGVRRVERAGERVLVYGEALELFGAVAVSLERSGVRFQNLRTERPNLEDVFLALTGAGRRNGGEPCVA